MTTNWIMRRRGTAAIFPSAPFRALPSFDHHPRRHIPNQHDIRPIILTGREKGSPSQKTHPHLAGVEFGLLPTPGLVRRKAYRSSFHSSATQTAQNQFDHFHPTEPMQSTLRQRALEGRVRRGAVHMALRVGLLSGRHRIHVHLPTHSFRAVTETFPKLLVRVRVSAAGLHPDTRQGIDDPLSLSRTMEGRRCRSARKFPLLDTTGQRT